MWVASNANLLHCRISHIEYIHSQHYIHCNIKPENLLIGVNQESHIVNIINFGLVKKYHDEATLFHIPYQTYRSLAGIVCYVSLNTHLGVEQTQCNNLESLAYIFIYFLHTSLLWQYSDSSSRKQKHHTIMQLKLGIPVAELCFSLPKEFQTILHYSQNLLFNALPNYRYICTLFQNFFTMCGYDDDQMVMEQEHQELYSWSITKFFQHSFGINLSKLQISAPCILQLQQAGTYGTQVSFLAAYRFSKV
jgi:serine/threonine protein kinase